MKEVVVDLTSVVILTGIGTICTYATIYLKKLTDKVKGELQIIKTKEDRELYIETLNEIDRLASKTVCAIEQEKGKQLREAAKSAYGERSSLTDLKQEAYVQIMENLKSEYKECLRNNMNDYRNYIRISIENQVYRLKSNLK